MNVYFASMAQAWTKKRKHGVSAKYIMFALVIDVGGFSQAWSITLIIHVCDFKTIACRGPILPLCR